MSTEVDKFAQMEDLFDAYGSKITVGNGIIFPNNNCLCFGIVLRISIRCIVVSICRKTEKSVDVFGRECETKSLVKEPDFSKHNAEKYISKNLITKNAVIIESSVAISDCLKSRIRSGAPNVKVF